MRVLRNIQLLIFLLVIGNITIHAQQPVINFEHYSLEEGLSNESINCFLKDSSGYLWIGTFNGLNKFDGYNFKIYKHDIYDTSSVINNNINNLLQDKHGNIWIGTMNGMMKYIPERDNFQRNYLVPSEAINCMYEDKDGVIYVACSNSLYQLAYEGKYQNLILKKRSSLGETILNITADTSKLLWTLTSNSLYRYNSESGVFSRYSAKYENKPIFDLIDAISINKDSRGLLWISKSNGLDIIDPATDKFIARWHRTNNDYFSSITNVIEVCEDQKNHIWILTVSNGLFITDHQLNRYYQIRNNPNDPTSINSHQMSCIYRDNSGIIWLGTQNEGINKYDPYRLKFKDKTVEINEHPQRANRSVKSIYRDRAGFYWIGTDYGLNKTDSNFHILQTFRNDITNPNSISIGGIATITEDYTGNLWVGSWGGCLNRLNIKTGVFKHYNSLESIDTCTNYFASNCIMDIAVDDSNNLWFGLINGYLDRLDAKTQKIEHFNLNAYWLVDLLIDKDILWCANVRGLVCFDLISKKYITFTGKQFGQMWQRVNAIAKDEKNTLWLATEEGLVHFDHLKNRSEVFDVSHGLLSNFILAIQIDKQGAIWLSSDKGISKFNPETGTCYNYEKNDGVKPNAGYSYQTNTGLIFFGGTNGLNAFYPNEIVNNKVLPKVEINGFKLFNKPITVNSNSVLKQTINTTKEIILDYDQTVITFEFVALNLTSPSKNKYAYKMEGFDKEWQYIGSRRDVTFTNLDPGEYTFKVKASNNDGLWNEKGASIQLIIHPPFWKRWWFKLLLILIACLSIISWIRYKTFIIRLHNERLERIVQVRTKQLEEQKAELEEQKSETERMTAIAHETDLKRIRFLINISHEFRTPLTLIINPIEKIISKISAYQEIASPLQVIARNSRSLLNLINQVLDMRKLETNNMSLQIAEYDLDAFLNNIYESFSQLADSQSLYFIFNNNPSNIKAWFDAQKVERVLINLLSNAFKFTPKFGSIELNAQLSENNERIWITVSDTGIGIPEDKIRFIFDRYYQVKSDKSNTFYGTGIGLNLAKELIELHHGTISVNSIEGTGSKFYFEFPIIRSSYMESEIAEDKTISTTIENSISSLVTLCDENSAEVFDSSIKPNIEKPKILIIEDSKDLRLFIMQNLTDTYTVYLAEDGIIGFQKALEVFPDLIICDIAMPRMDGFELCAKCKADQHTSHIPIILLTSRSNAESQIQGLENGADDYITKPFNIEVIKARIVNLIESRKRLKERFVKEIIVAPSEITITSLDEQFLQKAIEIVEKNILSPDLDVETLSKEMFLGRRQLLNKLKALTDLTPVDFIRIIRLKRAAQLLKSGMKISNVAYETGFSDPKYFSKVFKKHFGYSPSACLKNP